MRILSCGDSSDLAGVDRRHTNLATHLRATTRTSWSNSLIQLSSFLPNSMVTDPWPAHFTRSKAPSTPVLPIQQLSKPFDAPEWSQGIYDGKVNEIVGAVNLIPMLQADMRRAQLEQ